MKLVVIDYGLCNLRSVYNALKFLGVESMVTTDPGHLQDADAVILPGVGAFEDGMKGLASKGFVKPIHAYASSGRPLLGICLGMQMLMSKSYEFGEFDGLGLIEGEVKRFKDECVEDGINLRIPHISWNGLYQAGQPWEHTVLGGLPEGTEMYFIHSYCVFPSDAKHILAKTGYGSQSFCSVVKRDNVYGCQAHPEKSAKAGLKILSNFVTLNQHV